MSYNSIARCAEDGVFARRLAAAYAGEGALDPSSAAQQRRWTIAADPSIAEPYEYAVDAGNPDPGGDPAVVSDELILAAVQAHPWPTPPPE